MSVRTALGLTQENLDGIIGSRWATWCRADAALPSPVNGMEAFRGWLQSEHPARVDAALRALATLAHVDHVNDCQAATVLAAAMLPAAVRIAEELRATHPVEIDHHVAAHLWITSRTVPWKRRGRIAIWFRWELYRAVAVELGLPEIERRLKRSALPAELAAEQHSISADEELRALITEARRCGDLSSDDVELLAAVLRASSAAVPGTARGAALLGLSVSQAVAPLRGRTSRTVRRQTRTCIDALKRLASA